MFLRLTNMNGGRFMEKRSFIAFAMSMFLICLCATVFIACEHKDHASKAPLTENAMIYGELTEPKSDGLPLLKSENKDIEAEVTEVTDTSIKFKLDTSLSEIWTGEPYTIEMFNDGGYWQSVPTTVPEDEIAWIQPSYTIPGEFEINWSFLYGQLPSGNYRIVKQISGEIEVPYVWVYFEIEPRKTSSIIKKADLHVKNQITDYTKDSEYPETIDISAEEAKEISDILCGAEWTEFVYDGSEPILDYYHIWAEGYVIDYFMNEGKFEGIDFSKTTAYSSVFPANRLRLVLTEEQKEVVDEIVGKYFAQPSRTNCY